MADETDVIRRNRYSEREPRLAGIMAPGAVGAGPLAPTTGIDAKQAERGIEADGGGHVLRLPQPLSSLLALSRSRSALISLTASFAIIR